jgi:hypothetical protein
MVVIKLYNSMGKVVDYKLHKNQDLVKPDKKRTEIVIMQVCRLFPGACFGLGKIK